MARKLLLADDSITIQKVVELVLAEEGFDIKAVGNGEDALAAMGSFKPDIVLADIEMPKMNGYQLCEKIKTNPSTKDVPVILLSGAFEPLDEELAKNVKADTFVVKPFESQELISKINSSLFAPAAEEEVVMAEPFEEAVEAVAAEAVGAEEDLWAMEAEAEPAEVVEAEPAAGADIFAGMEFAEAEPTEEVGIAEEVVEAEEAAIAEVMEEVESPSIVAFRPERPAPISPERPARMPEISMPSKEELASMFKKTVDERISAFLSKVDMKSAVLSAMSPVLKDSTEKILWEVAPELTEKVLRDMIQSSLASLNKEVEKIIWEAVPEIAERMIAKEIEKIRSEI